MFLIVEAKYALVGVPPKKSGSPANEPGQLLIVLLAVAGKLSDGDVLSAGDFLRCFARSQRRLLAK
jgi:hypothetical protein